MAELPVKGNPWAAAEARGGPRSDQHGPATGGDRPAATGPGRQLSGREGIDLPLAIDGRGAQPGERLVVWFPFLFDSLHSPPRSAWPPPLLPFPCSFLPFRRPAAAGHFILLRLWPVPGVVIHADGVLSAGVRRGLRPAGTFDNSPAVHCWDPLSHDRLLSSHRDDRTQEATLRSSPRDDKSFLAPLPSDESLGYFRVSLRDDALAVGRRRAEG